jgi:dienelactone hydrolase
MIERFFHRWEERLHAVSRHERVVRPFEWGVDWIDRPVADADPRARVHAWVDEVMKDTDAFFTPPPTRDYTLLPPSAAARAGGEAGTLVFPSAFQTPHPDNNLVRARFFPANPVGRPRGPARRLVRRRLAEGGSRPESPGGRRRRGVVVLAQWNSDSEGHVGLCRLLAKLGVASLRISLPYHDQRMPPELTRADYIVSSNIVRTVQVCRQAVLDVRRALWWLRDQGYDHLGLLGTSLGSCLCMLTASHEPLVRAQALNHVSPFFGDVVWRGISTDHVRRGLEGHVDIDELRELWRPISPWSYIERARATHTLLVCARYDLTFPLDLSQKLVDEFRRRDIPVSVATLPCGHYTTGVAPFKYLDGWYLGKFLATRL